MGVIVDYFAGGGGASTGVEMAYGRKVDLAVNHDPEAVAMHMANHPETEHAISDVFEFDVIAWLAGREWDLWWASPDCTHHSRAKGGKPVENKRRALADVVVATVEKLPAWQRPRVIHLENVPEFREWGPLDATGRPDKARKGEFFRAWCDRLRACGYDLDYWDIVCANVDTPTTRKRLVLVARCDGLPVVKPVATNYDPKRKRKPGDSRAGMRPWRTAASDVIDFSIPGRSIFGRKKPLAEATLTRVARGVKRFVIDNPKPFIVSVAHGYSGGRREYGVDEPLGTVHASGQSRAVVEPQLAAVHLNVTRNSQKPWYEPSDPTHTVVADGARHNKVDAVLAPFLAGVTQSSTPRVFAADAPAPTVTTAKGGELIAVSAHMLRLQGNDRRDRAADEPLGAVMASGQHHAHVAAFMAQYNNHRGIEPSDGRSIEQPLSTITTIGTQQALVEVGLSPGEIEAGCERVLAFMLKYYGTHERGVPVDAPIDSVTTKDRFALITVHIAGVPYRIFDIRMLTPRELYNAQGFPPSYIINPWVMTVPKPRKADLRAGRVRVVAKRMSKSSSIAKCGNSVPPPLAYAVAKANAPPMSRLEGRSRWQDRRAA